MSVLHVRQIETFLKANYADSTWVEALDKRHNLSRLLARYCVDLGLSDRNVEGSCLIEVTDSGDDKGIDAIGVDPVTAYVVVVQSKWRNDGSGSVDLAAMLKFVNGIQGLVDFKDAEIPSCSAQMQMTVREAIGTPGGHLHIVLGSSAGDALADEVEKPMRDLLYQLNGTSERPIASFECVLQNELYGSITSSDAPAVDLQLQLLQWGAIDAPSIAYYGRISALAVGEWFATHGQSLFSDNIRVLLPDSDINDGIARSLREEPQNFWFYNNGITVLARKIEWSVSGAANKEAGYFVARGASVVNGAQTVSTLGAAFIAGEHDALRDAQVHVRCIEVSDEASDLGHRITRFANTQNEVSTQDFVFLDKEQHRLVKELKLLGWEYILRAGEVPVSEDRDRVIDVRQAAVALACASTDLSHAVLAKREVSRLFDAESGPYRALFNPTTNGVLLYRAVEAVRIVTRRFRAEAKTTTGTESGIAVNSPLIVAHVLLNAIGRKKLSDPEFDFAAPRAKLAPAASSLIPQMAAAFPENAYPGNLFKNRARCGALLDEVAVPVHLHPAF